MQSRFTTRRRLHRLDSAGGSHPSTTPARRWDVGISLAAATSLVAGSAWGQSVPGSLVEVFSLPPSPTMLTIAADGTLYAGRDDAAGGSATPTFITRIHPVDGSTAPYGNAPIPDADVAVVDETGSASGVPGAVLVGGLVTNSGPGRVTAIHPDGTVVTLFESPAFGNISEMRFDADDRLLFVSVNGNAIFASEAGAFPTSLCPIAANSVFLAIAPDGRLFTSSDAGVIRINAADGTLINSSFAQFTGRVSIEFANGGGFGTDLLALESTSGKLFRVSEAGVKTEIGSNLSSGVQGADLAVGQCGELYVCRRETDDVLRISNSVSPDLDASGTVDGADLGALLALWGTAECSADLDGNGIIDGADLGALLSAWGDVR